jgi:D-glycero-beta-D-manno-heptose-7-phosphate kinase
MPPAGSSPRRQPRADRRMPRHLLASTSDGPRLLELVDRFPTRRVAVVGDLIADEFIYGRVERVSREAPVLILRYDTTIVVPGGAGNAANNAAALGARVRVAGLAGRDEAGRRMTDALGAAVNRTRLLTPVGYSTPVKTRILAGGVHSAKQQVVRIDRITNGAPDAALRRAFEQRSHDVSMHADAVLVSDYGSGLVTPALVARLRRLLWSARPRVPILVDSRYAVQAFHGLTASTPNESEVEHILGLRIGDDTGALERAGREMLRRTRMQALLVTRGGRGMALFQPNEPTRHIPIFGSDEIADVTGAGDTVIATMAVALSAGASFYEAARLANYAGGIVVMKRGTATVSANELRAAIRSEIGAPVQDVGRARPAIRRNPPSPR